MAQPRKPLGPTRGLLVGLTAVFMLRLTPAIKINRTQSVYYRSAVLPYPPPLFRVRAWSLYEAGLQHGRLAVSRMQGWFATEEVQKVFSFVASGEGAKAFAQMKTDNEAEFPEYAAELKGIADGSGLPLDQIWCVNMLTELERLIDIHEESQERNGHCSDIYAISPNGRAHSFAHGHHEDWTAEAKPFLYFISYSYSGSPVGSDRGPGFASCAGMTFPGTILGWAPTWNKHGIYATQNTVEPKKARVRGLAGPFVQRRAICTARTLDDAISGLTQGGWSDGASVNVVDLHGKRMANVEVWEDSYSSLEVNDKMGNYSHFNDYKHLQYQGKSIDDGNAFGLGGRQERIDALPAPRTDVDVMNLLSDAEIFEDITVSTFVLNGTTGKLSVWCGKPPMHNPPAYNWDLLTFFEDLSTFFEV